MQISCVLVSERGNIGKLITMTCRQLLNEVGNILIKNRIKGEISSFKEVNNRRNTNPKVSCILLLCGCLC